MSVVGLTLGGRLAQYPALEYAASRVSRDADVDILWFHSLAEQRDVHAAVQRLRTAGHPRTRAVLGLPSNGTYCDVNKLRLLPSFWARLQLEAPQAEQVLIFEADSATCGQNLPAFIAAQRYDYCGAPWPANKKHSWAARLAGTEPAAVGNAGFSLWRISTAARLTAARQRELEARGHLSDAGSLFSRRASQLRHEQLQFHLARLAATGYQLRAPMLNLSASNGMMSKIELNKLRATLLRSLQAEAMTKSPCWETDVVYAHWCTGRSGFPSAEPDVFDPPLEHVPCHVCPLHVANAFAVENFEASSSLTPFGFHKPWMELGRWMVQSADMALYLERNVDDIPSLNAPLAAAERNASHRRLLLAGRTSFDPTDALLRSRRFSDANGQPRDPKAGWERDLAANPCLATVRAIKRLCGRHCGGWVVRRLSHWPPTWTWADGDRHRLAKPAAPQLDPATLTEGTRLESWPSGKHRLVMQSDANLVLYSRREDLQASALHSEHGLYWSTHTSGGGECPCKLVLRSRLLALVDSKGNTFHTIRGRSTSMSSHAKLPHVTRQDAGSQDEKDARTFAYFADLTDEGRLRLSRTRQRDKPSLVWELDLLRIGQAQALLRAGKVEGVHQLVYWPAAWAPQAASRSGPVRSLLSRSGSAEAKRDQAILGESPAALVSQPAARLKLMLQDDANLVLYGTDGSPTARWSSNTANAARCPCKLVLSAGGLKLVDLSGDIYFMIGRPGPPLQQDEGFHVYVAGLRDDGKIWLSREVREASSGRAGAHERRHEPPTVVWEINLRAAAIRYTHINRRRIPLLMA